ncbi:MAG TPA: hypothetical protein PLD68_00620 [Clostridiales bacterium]|nr:hypothetical protein [Clostridiales bacterium]
MKKKCRKAMALIAVLAVLAAALTSCDGGENPATTVPVTDAEAGRWQNALPEAEGTTLPQLLTGEINDIISKALGEGAEWKGDYAALREAQRKAVKDAFEKLGYDVTVTDSGIRFNPGENGLTVSDVYKTGETVSDKVISGLQRGFVKTFNTSGNDIYSDAVACGEDGFAAVGIFGTADGDCKDADSAWTGVKSMLVRYSAKGEVLWKSFLGGGDGATLVALDRLKDGGFVAVGQTKSAEFGAKPGNMIEGLIAKYSADGKKLWAKVVGGSKNEYFSSVCATSDGGFLVGGKTESSNGDFQGLRADSIKAVLIKYDANGNMLWKRALTGTMHSNIEGIAVNAAGEIYATCETMSSDGSLTGIAGRGNADTVIVKYDKNGKPLWVNCFSGSGIDELVYIAAAPDGGCVIGGRFSIAVSADGSFKDIHNAGGFDAFLVKYNPDGTIGWTRSIAGFLNDRITGIAAVDGGYAVCGISESSNRDFAQLGNLGEQDGFVMLLSEAAGSTTGFATVAGKADDVARSICASPGGKLYLVGGTTSSDGTFMNVTPAAKNGNFAAFAVSFTFKSE